MFSCVSDAINEDEDADELDENDEEFQSETGYVATEDIQTHSDSKELETFSVYFNDSIEGELYSYCQIAFRVILKPICFTTSHPCHTHSSFSLMLLSRLSLDKFPRSK